jgi:hypothetical protein
MMQYTVLKRFADLVKLIAGEISIYFKIMWMIIMKNCKVAAVVAVAAVAVVVGKWSGPTGRRDSVGVVKVHSRLWRETALLRATGGSVLEGIRSEVVRWLSPFFKHV